MSNRKQSVDEIALTCNNEQDEWRDGIPESSQIKDRIQRQVGEVFGVLERMDDRSFDAVEKTVISHVFTLGRLFLAFFLAWRHEHSSRAVRAMKTQDFRVCLPQPRLLGTYFGKVRYWRTYLRRRGGGGIYPLDADLGLNADGFSFNILSLAARLATFVSYDQVAGLLSTFLAWSPSKMSIEKAVLGLGRHTAAWFEKAPPPEGDGEVLVVQIDLKATPTATDSELQKRRGKRGRRPAAPSPRHRGRRKRLRLGSKPRRKKGDKSKNGRAVTLVVMYTLKRMKDSDDRWILAGPLNRRFYGSYAGKRHAFAIARREANKRGFSLGCRKRIQFVSDGDEDLARLRTEFFPEAIHTLDVMHVMEYLWEAGGCLFAEGSREQRAWVKKMEGLLYRGKAIKVVGEVASALERTPKTGPGNKGRRERLEKVRDYLFNRIDMMNYGWLRDEDLELSSGSVEGAVKHVIAKRFDNGSMRWIRERAEALLQLRCIDLNGDWTAFTTFVHEEVSRRTKKELASQRILTWTPGALPSLDLTA